MLIKRITRRQLQFIVGVGLVTLGAAATLLLAYLGSSDKPLAAEGQAYIALCGILAQAGSAWIFSREGRADPTLAQSSVARLIRRGQRANIAKLEVERLFEANPGSVESRKALGKLSVTLSFLEEGFLEAIEDWRLFHPNQVQSAEERRDRDAE